MKLQHIKCHQAVSTQSGAKMAFTVGLEGVQSITLEGQIAVITIANKRWFVPLANIPYGSLPDETPQEAPKAPTPKKK